MSLDIDIYVKKEVSVFERNVTYNLSDMYHKAIDREKGFDLLNNMSCREAIPILDKAIKDMIDNKEEYEKLNPPNGWGTYEGLLKTLKDIKVNCENNLDGRIGVM